ncbi:MAG: hypothetical protein LBV04_06280 [Deferribacteraceae bacterium]|nr:hypothetical protein [Deferribacteraceae bacterium]
MKQARNELDGDIYLVGGALRDMLLSLSSSDLDFVAIGDYKAYAKLIAKELHSHTVLFKDNIRIPYAGGYIDISAPRGATIEEDLRFRDFTINNLAMSMDGEIIGDPSDLESKRIVPVYDRTFDDDPVRILRGFRQAATLGFTLSEAFIELAKAKMPLLATVAGERIYEELKKFANAKHATALIYEQAEKSGLWQMLADATPDIEKLFGLHSLNVPYRDAFTEDERLTLFLAVLFANGNVEDIEKLHPSRQVQRGCVDLLNKSKPCMAEALNNPERAAWHYYKLLPLLLPFIEHYYGFNPDILLAAIDKINAYNGYLVNGATMLAAAPDRQSGHWISDIMDDCNFRLTFGLLQGEDAALAFIKKKIGELQ